MEAKEKHSSISFTDVLWRMAEGWKLILVLMVLGLLISLVYTVKVYPGKTEATRVKNAKNSAIIEEFNEKSKEAADYNALPENEQESAAAHMREVWASRLTEDQLAAVNNAVDIKRQMLDLSKYMKDSVLMDLDAYNVSTLYMVYEIKADSSIVANFLTSYLGYLSSIDCTKAIAEELGFAVDGLDDSIYNELLVPAGSGASFNITYQYRDNESLEKVSTKIKSLLSEEQKVLKKELGDHTINCVESVISVKANTALGNTKNTYQQYITNYNNQITSLKGQFDKISDQRNLYESLANLEEGGNGYVKAVFPADLKDVAVSPLRSKKVYLIVGLFLGLIAGAAVIYLKMLFATKLQKTEDLGNIYDLKVLGRVPGYRKLGIDKKLYFLKNHKNGPSNEEGCVDMAATAILHTCGKAGIRKLGVISTSANEKDKSLLTELAGRLEKSGLEISFPGDMNRDIEAGSKAAKTDAVLVAERICRAKYKNVDQEISVLKALDIPVAGVIGIE